MNMEETYSRDAPECPYCGYKQTHDADSFYDEDLTEIYCGSCGQIFDVVVDHRTTWTCRTREE